MAEPTQTLTGGGGRLTAEATGQYSVAFRRSGMTLS
jgi:hypothetical protein